MTPDAPLILSLLHSVVAILSGLSAAVLAFYSVHAILMVYLYRRLRVGEPRPEKTREDWPVVTVQVPIFNERYVVRRLLQAVCSLDYPSGHLEIQVLDDSDDETSQIAGDLVDLHASRGIDIVHIRRSERTGYKAGALRAGLEVAKGEYLAIFDADFVPPTDFLTRLMPYFASPDIAAVQARWGHLNADHSLLTRGMSMAIDAHFVVEHAVRHAADLFVNFNGTAGIWRREAILDAGNWQADTLTEDLDISYRAQLAGWKIEYVNDVVCDAEIPAEVNGIKTQQYRWAKGSIQTARKLLSRIWTDDGLRPLVLWEATTHLTHHLVFPTLLLVSLLAPPLAYFRSTNETSPTLLALGMVAWAMAFGYPLFYGLAQAMTYPDWKRRLLRIPLLYLAAFGLSIVNSKAVLSALSNRRSPFVRTPKYSLDSEDTGFKTKSYAATADWTAIAEVAMSVYCAVGVYWAAANGQMGFVPWLLVPTLGFGWIGSLSVARTLHLRRRAILLDTEVQEG